jgi:hypothetical protein
VAESVPEIASLAHFRFGSPTVMKLRRILRQVSGALPALLLCCGPAMATEQGGSSYPVGVEIAYGDMLKPGLYQLMYYNKSHAGSIKGNAGQDLGWARYEINADTISYRLQYVWDTPWLGASVESGASIPFPDIRLKRQLTGGSPSLDGNRTGLTDPLFFPLRLSWKGEKYSQSLNFEIIAPLGAYDVAAKVNTGRNYWQFAPLYAVSWRPADNVIFGIKFRYGINTKNRADNYRSGDEFTTEFSAGVKWTPQTTIGLQGYLFRQTSDDELNGQPTRLPGTGIGNRGSVNAIGPFVSHAFSPRFILVGKLQNEFAVKNRGQFDKLWLQALLPF